MQCFEIREDDLSGDAIVGLLKHHLAEMVRVSPEGGVNALSIERLREPDTSFFSLWAGGNLAGCGALKRIDDAHAEIKSMRTAPGFLRQGVGEAILVYLIDEARRRGHARLSLETGRTTDYDAARALYRKYGFANCPPFGGYRDDGFSQCMTRAL